MTEIAFSRYEGAEWEYFNSPLSEDEIMRAIAVAEVGKRDFPAIFVEKDCSRFYPDGDTLPKCHAILLEDGSRWDAFHCKWMDNGKQRAQELFAVLRKQASWIPQELAWRPCPDDGFFPRTETIWLKQ